MEKPDYQRNEKFERKPEGDNAYKVFCGFFYLEYREFGKCVRNFSMTDVGIAFGTAFSSFAVRSWFALHDRDTFEGNLKLAHVHFVVWYPKKVRWKKVFKDICDCFHVPHLVQGLTSDGEFAVDENGKPMMENNPWLTMSVCVSPIGAIRYLIHADDKNKFQYTFNDILTNDIAMAKMAMMCPHGALTSDVLTRLVWECHGNVRVICNMMGLDYFAKYNSVIKMLVSQYRYDMGCSPNASSDFDASEPVLC